MAKRKLLILPFIVALIVSLGIMLTACGSATMYSITWEVSEHATVTVVGADAIPEQIEEEATLSFKVEPKTGYEISSVRINDRAVNADKNGIYSTTVKADLKIVVETAEVIESVTVKTNPTKTVYFAGETLDPAGMEVEVKYATSRTETVDSYSVIYSNGSAFALGDTSFSVKYKGVTSAAVTFETAVKAKITLKLNDGHIAADQLTALSANDGYNYDETKGEISWTYSEALTADITLPEPTLPVEGIEFPFLRWSGEGIKDGKVIPTGTNTSITAVATYETKIVELASIGLTTETVTETVGEGDEAKEVTSTVAYLVIKGEFKAATEGYLFLYEGNEPPVELKGDDFKKTGDTAAFTIKFDMRKLVATGYTGKWMDIKFCSKIGGTLYTQEIDLNNYPANFIVGDEEISIIEEADMYKYTFHKYTPNAGDKIKGGNGETYLGTEKLLKVSYTKSTLPDYTITGMTLEERDSKPYVVINGTCVVIKTKAEAEEKLANFIKDMQKFSNWDAQEITQTLVVTEGESLTFEVAVCIEKVTTEGDFIMHSTNYGDFNPSNYDKEISLTVGDYTYTINSTDPHNWGWSWTGIHVVDNAKIDGVVATSVSVVEESGVAYLVISGTHQADAEKAVHYFNKILNGTKGNDLQNMTDWGYGYVNATGEGANATVTADATTWTIKVDLAKLGLTNALHNFHLFGADLVKTDALTVTNGTVTAGGKTYVLDVQNHWNADRPILTVSDAVVETPAA